MMMMMMIDDDDDDEWRLQYTCLPYRYTITSSPSSSVFYVHSSSPSPEMEGDVAQQDYQQYRVTASLPFLTCN